MMERTKKKKTQNLAFKYKEQRAELSSFVTVIPSLLFIEKKKTTITEFQGRTNTGDVPAIFSFI